MGRLNSSSYRLFLVFLGIFVLAGLLIVFRLRRDIAEEAPVTDDDVLKDIERAYYAGQMEKAEFERVTAALRAKKEAGATPIPVAPEPESKSADPPADGPSGLGELS